MKSIIELSVLLSVASSVTAVCAGSIRRMYFSFVFDILVARMFPVYNNI